MIAKASSVSHGANALSYALEKSQAEILRLNKLEPSTIPSSELIWNSFSRQEIHSSRANSIERNVIRIEIAPSVEESAQLKTKEDWLRLLDEWIEEMDKPRVIGEGKEARKVPEINIKGSQYVAVVHYDSGKPHIHLVVNRVDENGKVNSDKFIGERAVAAANAINAKRGWLQPNEINEVNVKYIYGCAIRELKDMSQFNWKEFVDRMHKYGINLKLKFDSNKHVVSYRAEYKGHSYKASEIGPNKQLTAAHIFNTWLKEHPESQYWNKRNERDDNNRGKSETENRNGNEKYFDIENHQERIRNTAQMNHESLVDVEANCGGQSVLLSIKNDIAEALSSGFMDEANNPENEPKENDMAVAASLFWAAKTTGTLFYQYLEMATECTDGGGGGGVQGELSSWGQTTDEDELKFAMRCGHKAADLTRAGKKSSRRRGGRR